MGSSRITGEGGNEFGVDDTVANALGSVTHCHGHPSHVVGNLEFAYSPLLGGLEDLLADSFFIPKRKDRDYPPFQTRRPSRRPPATPPPLSRERGCSSPGETSGRHHSRRSRSPCHSRSGGSKFPRGGSSSQSLPEKAA